MNKKRPVSISIKHKIIWPVVIMLLISSSVAGFIVFRNINAADEKGITDELNGMRNALKQAIGDAETAAGMVTANLAANNDFQFSVTLQDKSLLDQNTAPVIKTLEKDGFLQGYFDITDSEGKVIYAGGQKWLEGKNLADTRLLMKNALSARKKVSGIEAGPDGLYVRAISPVIYNGDFSGVVEFNVSMPSILKKVAKHSSNLDIAVMLPAEMISGFHSHADFIKTRGRYLAYPTSRDTFATLPPSIASSHFPATVRQGDILFHLFDMPLQDKGTLTVVFAYDTSNRTEAVINIMMKLGTTLLASTLIVAIIMALFFSVILSPLKGLVSGMATLAGGKFTHYLPSKADDEFGKIARLYNNILFSFGQLVKTLQDDADNIVHATSTIKVSNNQFNKGIRFLDKQSDELALNAEAVSSSLQQTSQSMNDLATASSEIASSVAASAASATEVLEMSSEAKRVIDNLGEHSNKIGEIVQVINAVAEQTNLLALNATIEAARAGEAGKGFAVVANEVKELAKQTGEATEKIAQMIHAIQSDTARAVAVTDEIGSSISSVTDMTSTIASATEEQTATISEISSALESGMQEVKTVASMADSLKQEVNNFADSMTRTVSSQTAITELAQELQTVARYFSVSDSALEAAEADAFKKIKVMNITLQHFKWKQALILSILDGVAKPMEHDPTRCALGSFIKNSLINDPKHRDVAEKLSKLHAELHTLGHTTVSKIDSGASKEANVVFTEQITPLFKEILDLLEQLKSMASDTI